MSELSNQHLLELLLLTIAAYTRPSLAILLKAILFVKPKFRVIEG